MIKITDNHLNKEKQSNAAIKPNKKRLKIMNTSKTFNTATIEQHKSMIIDAVNDGRITDGNIEDLHHGVFNTDYFIIGYYEAEQWIINNFDSVFSAIEIVRDYEMSNFDTFNTEINSEKIAGMLSYICGEEVIGDLGCLETLEELKEALEIN